jgi:hypothetical protein
VGHRPGGHPADVEPRLAAAPDSAAERGGAVPGEAGEGDAV